MKQIFFKFMTAAASDGAGHIDSTAVVLKAIGDMKADMLKKEEVTNLATKAVEDAVAPIAAAQAKTQEQVDKLDEKIGSININKGAKRIVKSLDEIIAEGIAENFKDIANVRKGSGFKVTLSLKDAAVMTNSNNLTGDGVINYGRNAFLPASRINMRDLIPTSQSSTLVQAYYRESAGEGSVGTQVEGAAKNLLDIDLTEVKTVTGYIAGYARYSKQMAKNLPFMQSTLPRILLRKFYDAENHDFFLTVTGAATGSTTTSETDDVKQIIDYIANQRTAKYEASYALVSFTQLARLNKLTYTSGYYEASGGVVTLPDGTMRISGVPLIASDWVTDDKVLIIDRDYLERVEAESLTIEFFEQDSDNVQKNLITARVECLEEVNPMMPASMIYADLGNV